MGRWRRMVGLWVAMGGMISAQGASVTMLNVSYDPTRELYQEFDKAFADYWKQKTGTDVTVQQSHGGSGKQARSVIDGLEADVVTLALAYDIDAISKESDLILPDWQKKLPNNSCPYTSTIVLLVRKGNPKAIKDWEDLAKPGVQVITPNPKTSGGARWNYLVIWGYAMKKWNDEAKARDLVAKVFKNVPVLDTGARGSTITFVERGIGDVMIAWENEALMAVESMGKDKLEIVLPSLTILAEPPVAVVDKVVDKRGTRAVAEAYLLYLYSEAGQEMVARHHYRPSLESVAAKYTAKFAKVEMIKIDDMFGGWEKAQQIHFSDGGTFDQIYQPGQ